MKRLCLLCVLSGSCLAATNVLHSPKALEQVRSLQKVTIVPKTFQLTVPDLAAAVLPATTNVTFVFQVCGKDLLVQWGTNTGVYQWSNAVSAGTTNLTITLNRGVRYYFSESTNCQPANTEFVYPPFPPTNYYSIYAQTSTNVSGPFSDISTNVLMRFTNNAPQDFFQLRIGVSQSP